MGVADGDYEPKPVVGEVGAAQDQGLRLSAGMCLLVGRPEGASACLPLPRRGKDGVLVRSGAPLFSGQ